MSNSLKEALRRLVVIGAALAALALSEFAFAGTDTYSYDALGRLVTVTYADGSTITYAYDSAGNRTAVTQTAAP